MIQRSRMSGARPWPAPSIVLRWLSLPLVFFLTFGLAACSRGEKTPAAAEAEALARTAFTQRVENYFEYDLLRAGKPSQFLIHLTDLADGSPVEKAEVVLRARPKGSRAEVAQTKARVGKVTGIYVAHLTLPHPGDYDLEFHIRNARLDERMQLAGFQVE